MGEFLILSGSFASFPWFTAAALLGVIFGAVYMLTLYLRTMYGGFDEEKNGDLTDVTDREVAIFLPLVLLVLLMGLFPNPILQRMSPSIAEYSKAFAERSAELERARGSEAPAALLGKDLKE